MIKKRWIVLVIFFIVVIITVLIWVWYKPFSVPVTEGIRVQEKVVKQNPADTDAMFKLGLMYEKEYIFKPAETTYLAVLKSKPTDLKVMVRLGTIYGYLGKINKALDIFEKVLISDSNNAEALVRLGDMECRMAGKSKDIETQSQWMQKASLHLDKSVKKFPNDYIVYLIRGVNGVYWPEFTQRYKVSQSDLEHLLAMNKKKPDSFDPAWLPEIYYYLAQSYFLDKSYDKAKNFWTRTITEYPGTYWADLAKRKLPKTKKYLK